ncbi:YqgE/AlgH family protein [Sulfitobacter sp. SK012]|uniref:YqgE/AlgH family protein n=1 Tax=Sulfitobacter sp. SK012 TaxID=1389005 RepID=UPI0020C808C0|nr:YqgE/AlgH family protein [Sulfitobacter sp. SK012]
MSKGDLQTDMDLTGQLLVAMPGMGDPRFERSVIYICSYSDEGAMGLIVNKSMPDLRLSDVLDRLEINLPKGPRDMVVRIGGPVESGRGFVLHSDEYRSKLKSLHIADGFAMTATQDILEDMAEGAGPAQALFLLGYAGWGPGQLEREIGQNGWLTCPADTDLVFATKDRLKWQSALTSIGIDPLGLSSAAGRA